VGSAPHRFFPPFRLDAINAQLWRGDQEISLRRKTFDMLLYLLDHSGQLVTKAALLDAVWAGVTVSDSMPATCVAELRKALGDEAKIPRFIETVHGRGYRFVANVTSAVPEVATRKPPVLPRGPKPIVVGREDELAQLQNWYSHVLEGQRRVVFIAGEAGIGKTAFVQAFLDSISQEGAVRLGRGQCVEQYGAGEPYMPVLEALSRLGQEGGGERVIELLNKFAPMWLAQMPALITGDERARLQGLNQGVTQQRMLREMAQALEALAAEAPLVLLLEDLQWSDFSTLELISAIARRSEPARLLILGTFRPVEMLAHEHPLRTMKQELELHRHCEELRLKLLNEQDVAGYLAKRFPSNGSRRFDSLAPAIHERTDGNPLFMINVVDYLVDAAFLASSREASAAKSAEILLADRIEVPRSVRQMIERNLERLKPEEQAVLEGASVAGAEFSAAAVAAALERPQNEVEACCARLSRREQFVIAKGPIAWPDGTVAAGFRFHHTLYQEVLYGLLPPGHRVHLHRLIAVREEAGYGERAVEIATELAHHYSRANDRNKAIHYFRLAGERAVTRGAVVEAEGHYNRALALLGELPQAVERDRVELALQMSLGGVLWRSRSWSHPEAGRAFARAEELAEKLGETNQLVAVLMGLKSAAHGSGQFALARELGERMLVAAESSGDRGALCVAHTRLGEGLIWRAQYAEARRHLDFGGSYYDEANRSELGLMGIDAPALAAIVALLLGFPDRARQLMNEGLRRAERRGDSFWMGIVHMWGGMFCGILRDGQGALEHAQALRSLAPKQPVFTGLADAYTGEALMSQGDWKEGLNYVRKGVAFHQSVGLLSQLMWAKLDEAEFFVRQGQVEGGLALVGEALTDSEELPQIRSPALRYCADLLAQSNRDALTIDAAYRAAIECARSQGARYYELQATTSFARWLKSQGRAAEAQTLLAEIYGWFTEGFDTPALSEAKALLDELSNKPSAPRRSNKSRKDR
jgi:DNA-binding winged helix-turn-helix (wHTH) protein